jgi:predicted short-subunit dehydrogenase-like oxidoreductase (DUF2520 family)
MIVENEISKVGFIGSGKVATQLAIALNEKRIEVTQVYSRNIDNATVLAEKVDASAIVSITDFNKDLDLIIVSISDSAFKLLDLSSVAKDTIVVHTSGSLSIDVLEQQDNYGVFYPLQTFNMFDKPDWNKIPICIETSNERIGEKLKILAKVLSNNIYDINSTERANLHLAAVFVCNFTNSMYAIGEELLDKNKISFDLLRPLIEETANKVMTKSPKILQTGPAVRNDKSIIKKHIDKLEATPDYADIYRLMTNVIYKQQNNT